jgi:hypothetical protein
MVDIKISEMSAASTLSLLDIIETTINPSITPETRKATFQVIRNLLQANLNSVTITGGSITGITPLAFAEGGTGETTAVSARTALGLVIGTDVQAQNARLQDIATNLSATSGGVEKTGANTFGTYTLTAAGKALIDDADATAQRTTLGLGTIATQNANGVNISGGSITGITDLAIADGGTGSSTAASARTELGLAIGTNVQAWDATLDSLAAYNTNGILVQTAADTFTGRTLSAPAAGLTITNPAGTAGNPAFALANDLAAIEGLSNTGFAVRTGTDTWTTRALVGSTNRITITNATADAGVPTFDIGNQVIITTGAQTLSNKTLVSGASEGTFEVYTTGAAIAFKSSAGGSERSRIEWVGDGALNIYTGGVMTSANFHINAAGNAFIGGDSSGTDSLRVNRVTSAVNRLRIAGAATGSSPKIDAFGSDSNLSMEIASQGTGKVFVSGQLRVNSLNNILAASAGDVYAATITSPLAFSGNALSINTNGIGDTLIRQGAATSVIGRSSGSSGNVADVTANADNDVLRRSGGILAFGGISTSSISTGVLGRANGGTGVSAGTVTSGQLFIGNGSGFSVATLTAGTGISIDNGAGAVTITNTGGAGSTPNILVSGATVATQPNINFVPGTNVTLTGVDVSALNRVNITINATGGGGSTPNVLVSGATVATQPNINFVPGSGITIVGVDASASNRVNLTFTSTGGSGIARGAALAQSYRFDLN